MAKFFYNKVYNSKKTIINIVIISVCVIGIIICFVLTSNFQGEDQRKPEAKLSIKSDVTIEVNENFSKDIFFSQIENMRLDDIEIVYPDNFDVKKIGKYEIGIVVDGETYTSNLTVVDTTKPELNLKEVTINHNSSYSANDFIDTCKDNSGLDCEINFYAGIDEEGQTVDYSVYKEPGTYPIKIEAKDESGNQAVGETRLIINNDGTTTEPESPTTPSTPSTPSEPTTCKYGNGEYDTDNYLLAVNITTNNCAVSLDLYKNSTITAEINKMMDSETIRIQKDVQSLNIKGTPSLNRLMTAVVNKTGDGIVGYELRMTVTIANEGNSVMVADYKLDNNGKRVYISNPYNLPN